MKYFFYIALLAAVLMTAGCSGGKQNAEVTPAQLTTVPATVPTAVPATVPAALQTQVSLYYPEGSTGECFSDPEKKIL